MKYTNYDVRCLSCSAEAGQIVQGRFVPHPGRPASPPHKGGRRRCGRCGGSLYLEPIDIQPLIVDWSARADRIAVG